MTWLNRVSPLMTYAVAVLIGAAALVWALAASFGQAPRLAAGSIVLFGLFGAACTWLLNKIPYRIPVRRTTKLLAALWGATAAAGIALLANRAIYDHFDGRGEWSLFTPFTEEPLKDLGIVVVLLLVPAQARTALVGLVVGSFVGLGFEVVEDVVQSMNNALASAPPGAPDNWGSLIVDVVHEVLRRSWTGHIVLSGIAGFGIAYAMTERPALRGWGVGAALVLLAFGGHLLWNSHRFGLFYVLGQFGVLAAYLWLIRIGRSRERSITT
ncbi:MAG: PrsW family intramembrane metalloprotease [Mycobacterium sp.]|nr:PrsW family intramembrane metalloprotease [Mycobacterium sp.]